MKFILLLLACVLVSGCISPYALLDASQIEALSKIREQFTFCNKTTTVYGSMTTVVTKTSEAKAFSAKNSINGECVTAAETAGIQTPVAPIKP